MSHVEELDALWKKRHQERIEREQRVIALLNGVEPNVFTTTPVGNEIGYWRVENGVVSYERVSGEEWVLGTRKMYLEGEIRFLNELLACAPKKIEEEP